MNRNIVSLFCLLVISLSAFAQDTTRLSLMFVGDIMQHDSQRAAAYDTLTKRYDYTSCFQYVKPYLDSADITIGNLEVTLAGAPYKGYPQFSAPDELALTLKDVGFDVLVTANNHCEDRGRKGLERTIMMLDSLEILHTGTFADTVDRLNDYPLLIQQKGFSIAILNYTYGTNGMPVEKPNMVNLIDTTIIKQDLIRATEFHPDAIITFMHWGTEYQSQPNKFQKAVTELCFMYGAKLVIGAHPHVLQPVEWRKESDQLVAYSLGNFVSGQRNRSTDGGVMLSVELEKITQLDSSSMTRIADANYQLEWVHRTSGKNKKYSILPANDFEGLLSELEVSADVEAPRINLSSHEKKVFQLFLDDSRSLFTKYNLGILELNKR